MSYYDYTKHPDLIEFFKAQRNRPEELYPSEKRFFPWLARNAAHILDIGCAAGGFVNIWRSFNPRMKYSGVDVSEPLVKAATELHTDCEFWVGNCAKGLDLPGGYADCVQALGWLHWEADYADALKEMWRLTKRFLFFDVRLSTEPGKEISGKQKIVYSGEWDGKTTTHYIVLDWPRFTALLRSLDPGRIMVHGYEGKPAESVMGVEQQICFATFVLEKKDSAAVPEGLDVYLDLPLDWPQEQAAEIRIKPPAELDKRLADES